MTHRYDKYMMVCIDYVQFFMMGGEGRIVSRQGLGQF